MPIVAVFQWPNFTQERYEATVRQIAGKDRMEKPSDWPVEGLLAHIAGPAENGFRVVDVWSSEETWQAFAEKIVPIIESVGMTGGAPEVYSTHTFVSA